MEDYNIISVTMHKDTHIHVPSHVCVRSLPYMFVTRPTLVCHTNMHLISFVYYKKVFSNIYLKDTENALELTLTQ